MKKLWARIGMSVEVTGEEHEKLKGLMTSNPREAEGYLITLFAEKGKVDGESYLPGDCEDNPNHEDFGF